MRKKADELVFTHDPWTRDASEIHDSLKSYHHARKKSCTSHEMKRYNRGVSPQGNGNCEAGSKAGMSYEFMHRAHRASTEGRKMGGSVGVWGTPVAYRGGLARRLCILLECTDPLSALAPKLQEVYGPYASAPASAAGATLRGARGWPRNWIVLLIMLANFQRA